MVSLNSLTIYLLLKKRILFFMCLCEYAFFLLFCGVDMGKNENHIYVLAIKRSVYKSLEIIGAYSSLYNAKNVVKKTFDNFNKKNPDSKEKYNIKNWERSKQDGRFYFYALSQDLNSFYQIVKLKIDPFFICEYGEKKKGKNCQAVN